MEPEKEKEKQKEKRIILSHVAPNPRVDTPSQAAFYDDGDYERGLDSSEDSMVVKKAQKQIICQANLKSLTKLVRESLQKQQALSAKRKRPSTDQGALRRPVPQSRRNRNE